MKPVEEYFPITFLVILYALLLLVLVTGGGEVTETNVEQTFTDAVYTADNLDTDEDVSSPVRHRVDVYQDIKR